MTSSAPAILAIQLLGRWTELARAHVPLGAGCACAPGFGGLRLGDFEEQVLDYLRTRHGSAVAAESIATLLHALARGDCEMPQAAQKALLADLARTLDSFDELHRGGRTGFAQS